MDVVNRSGIFQKNKPVRRTRLRQEALVGWLFLSPWLIGFVALKALPILASLVFSFTNFHMLNPGETQFIGMSNYAHFVRDAQAGSSLFGSLTYFLFTVPIEIFFALGLAAVFTSARLKNKRFSRTLIFMTSIIPATSIFFIFQGSLQYAQRLIVNPLGLQPINQFSLLLPFMALWSIGPGFLIMYGAMLKIPHDLYEAARIDGAGPLLRFLNITLPMISPAIFFSLVINLTSAFGGSMLLDRGYVFSQNLSISPMEGYIHLIMFTYKEMGYASALAWVMFGVTMTITILLFRSARRWVYFPEEGSYESL